MSKVIIRTFAYNAERTIERTIKSILKQTYKDFVWYVINNGSIDSTGDILEKYAQEDSRMIIIKNNINCADTEYTIEIFYDIINKYEDDCYFCTIDADDYYKYTFLEEMLSFIKKNKLDVAACSSVFLEEGTDKIIGQRVIEKELFIEGNLKEQYYTKSHQFMRTIWGKLFSLSVLRKCDFKKIKEISYGNDTYFTTEAFRVASRIGITDKILHIYYLHGGSVSSSVDKKRIRSSSVLLDQGIDYLKKYGRVSDKNLYFLFSVYYYSIKDTINSIINNKNNNEITLELYYSILSEKYLNIVISIVDRNEVQYLQNQFKSWLLSKEINFIVMHREKIKECLTILCVEDDLEEYIFDEDSCKFLYYIKCFQEIGVSIEKNQLEEKIKILLRKNNILSSLPIKLWELSQNIIAYVLDNNYLKAMYEYNRILFEELLNDSQKEEFIRMGQYISAILEDEEMYIYLKKMMIKILMEKGKFKEAEIELEDYDLILHEDDDFIIFRKQISYYNK